MAQENHPKRQFDTSTVRAKPAASKILVCLAHDTNRRLLADWLSETYDVTSAEGPDSLDETVDLCIIDRQTFGTYRDQWTARKDAENRLMLPYLLVSSERFGEGSQGVWQYADEVIRTPVSKAELHTRIEGLLDHRRRFIELSRRTELVETLNVAARQMEDVADPTAVAEIAVTAGQRVLDSPMVAIWLATESQDELTPVAQTGTRNSSLPVLSDVSESVAWQAYTSGETTVVDDCSAANAGPVFESEEVAVASELAVPLGTHGVVTVGSAVPSGFDSSTVQGTELLAATTASALERSEREQALDQRTSQLEFFNSVVRHDVLNAMMVIQCRAECLVEQADDEEQVRFAETILTNSEEAVDVIQRVRSIITALTGDSPVELGPVDVTAMLDRELDTIRTTYPEVDLSASVPPNLTAYGNELLADVLRNILTNAVSHNDPVGLGLDVTAEARPDTVTIRIADTGTGVPDGDKETIFRRGETGHAKSTGSGFGLFFADTMIDEYGGSLWVEDRTAQTDQSAGDETTGAVFVVELVRVREN